MDNLGDANMLGVLDNYGQDETVTNYYESEKYQERLDYVKQWMEMGCYMTDLMNVTEAPADLIPAERALGCFAGHFSAEMNGIWSSQNFGVDMASLQIYGEEAVAVTPGAYYCINPNTKNADLCAALLNEMATNPDAVSYTHLGGYKRQAPSLRLWPVCGRSMPCWSRWAWWTSLNPSIWIFPTSCATRLPWPSRYRGKGG